jgi:hypothetical protein
MVKFASIVLSKVPELLDAAFSSCRQEQTYRFPHSCLHAKCCAELGTTVAIATLLMRHGHQRHAGFVEPSRVINSFFGCLTVFSEANIKVGSYNDEATM